MDELRDRALQLRSEGKSMRQTATALGVSLAKVQRLIQPRTDDVEPVSDGVSAPVSVDPPIHSDTPCRQCSELRAERDQLRLELEALKATQPRRTAGPSAVWPRDGVVSPRPPAEAATAKRDARKLHPGVEFDLIERAYESVGVCLRGFFLPEKATQRQIVEVTAALRQRR